MQTPQIFEAITQRGGPQYDEALDAALARYARSHEALANWRPNAFEQCYAL